MQEKNLLKLSTTSSCICMGINELKALGKQKVNTELQGY